MQPRNQSYKKEKTEQKTINKSPIINIEKLKKYAQNDLNVILTGMHGVGKTTIIKEVFDSVYSNWIYLSGGTMDPWLDFIGVPKEYKDENGKEYLRIVPPESFSEDNIEAIYIDEFNRSPKSVRNAVLELIQFKSINGKKFNNLKVVWASINPDDEEETYDVEKLDPAQKDRFQIQIEIPYRPDYNYFKKIYGSKGHNACEWWFQLTQTNKLKVSPRRLEYAIKVHNNNGSLRDVIPHSCNISKLNSLLRNESIENELINLIKKTDEEIKEELSDYNYYTLMIPKIISNNQAIDRILPLIDKESLTELVTKNIKLRKHIIGQYNFNDNFREVVDNLSFTSNNQLRREIIKELEKTTINPSKINFKTETNKSPLNYSESILSSSPPIIPDIKMERDTISRKEKLVYMYDNMSTILTKQQSIAIINQLNIYCAYSQNRTINKNKNIILPILNHAKKFSGMSYKDIFTKNNKLWTKIYNCKLIGYLNEE